MDYLFWGFNLLLMVVGFGVLIVVHELGHFLAAKWAGIRTEAFSVGLGPAILTWRKQGHGAEELAEDDLNVGQRRCEQELHGP